MTVLAILGSALLLPPFAGWGVYTMYRRYKYEEEWSLAVESVTLLAVLGYVVLQLSLLRVWLDAEPLLYLFAVLGLIVSTAALYGHTAISVISRFLVDVVTVSDDDPRDRPRLGPVEALERAGDFEAALEEYLVIVRIFPHDAELPERIGELMHRLDRPRDAVAWFERAMRNASDAQTCLGACVRLAELQERALDEPAQARRTLTKFLERFPDASEATLIERRLEASAGAGGVEAAVNVALAALDAEPLASETAPREAEAPPPKETPIALSPLDGDPLEEEDGKPEAKPRKQERPAKPRPALGLEALDEHPLEEAPEEARPRPRRAGGNGLDALDERPLDQSG